MIFKSATFWVATILFLGLMGTAGIMALKPVIDKTKENQNKLAGLNTFATIPDVTTEGNFGRSNPFATN